MISILLTSYNYEKFIGKTIQSVINQTYTDWELIIVDDGSTDNSLNIIKEFAQKDSRIKYFTHPDNSNKGLVNSIKAGLEKTNGEWIVFLESDDLITPDNIEKKVNIINKYKDKVNLIFNDCELFGDEKVIKDLEKAFNITRKKVNSKTYPANMFYDFYTVNLIFTLSSIMVKKSDLYKIDLNPPIDALFDWWIYIQLAYLNNFYHINEKLTKWQIHKTSYVYSSSSTHRSPLDIQAKAYYKTFQKTKDYRIIFFIIFSHIKWVIYNEYMETRHEIYRYKKMIKNKIFNRQK